MNYPLSQSSERRAEHARALRARLTARVAEAAPPDVRSCPEALALVEAESVDFLDALDGWVRTGALEDARAVEVNARAVLAGWEEAARWHASRGEAAHVG